MKCQHRYRTISITNTPCDVATRLLSQELWASLRSSGLLEEVGVGGVVDHQVVAPVGVHSGPCRQWDALFVDGRPQVEVLDELLDVDTELA